MKWLFRGKEYDCFGALMDKISSVRAERNKPVRLELVSQEDMIPILMRNADATQYVAMWSVSKAIRLANMELFGELEQGQSIQFLQHDLLFNEEQTEVIGLCYSREKAKQSVKTVMSAFPQITS